jgi:hypothetical protein
MLLTDFVVNLIVCCKFKFKSEVNFQVSGLKLNILADVSCYVMRILFRINVFLRFRTKLEDNRYVSYGHGSS